LGITGWISLRASRKMTAPTSCTLPVEDLPQIRVPVIHHACVHELELVVQ
jgi:hypothetical protein